MGMVDTALCETWGLLSNRRTAHYSRQYGEKLLATTSKELNLS
jgi:hypothetical protein